MSESTQEAAAAEKKSAGGHGALDEHQGHYSENEYPYVAHHFDSPKQQLEAGKLGIWLFLVTEILFFAGLFCAYTIYRARYPEVFYWAHFYLDTNLGALNTIVLILSSLTAAWAVRNAQLGEQKLLRINILVTIACACTFMVVKYFEYSHKGHAGLLPGSHFAPQEELWDNEVFKQKHPEAAKAVQTLLADLEGHRAKIKAAEAAAQAAPAAAPASAGADTAPEQAAAPAQGESDAAASDAEDAAAEDVKAQADTQNAEGQAAAPDGKQAEAAEPETAAAGDAEGDEQPTADAAAGAQAADEAKPAGAGDAEAAAAAASPGQADGTAAIEGGTIGTAKPEAEVPEVDVPVSEAMFLASAIRKFSDKELKPLMDAGIIKSHPSKGKQLERPTRAHMFFSVYFFMTGLHGLHVLVGIGIWVWLLVRATKGQFGPQYFGPIDFAALYWHLVDLIWIYLFPLLYLIH